jgi:hypothetical protein
MTTSDGLAEADVHEGNEFLVRRSWFLVWAFDLLPPYLLPEGLERIQLVKRGWVKDV